MLFVSKLTLYMIYAPLYSELGPCKHNRLLWAVFREVYFLLDLLSWISLLFCSSFVVLLGAVIVSVAGLGWGVGREGGHQTLAKAETPPLLHPSLAGPCTSGHSQQCIFVYVCVYIPVCNRDRETKYRYPVEGWFQCVSGKTEACTPLLWSSEKSSAHLTVPLTRWRGLHTPIAKPFLNPMRWQGTWQGTLHKSRLQGSGPHEPCTKIMWACTDLLFDLQVPPVPRIQDICSCT